jgi:hypothetical protein
MTGFNDFDIEISDDKDSTPENFTGSVTTAGVPVTIAPTSTKPIQMAFVNVPSVRHDTPNAITDSIKVSLDGVTYVTLMSGESQYFPGVFSSIKLDSNADGTTYELILWS